jgi:DNA polymerase-3 subunit delta
MYRAFLGKDRGLQSSEISADFGYKGREFVIRNAIADSKRFDKNKFNLSFDALRKADKALKSFSSNPRTILEQLAVRLSYIAVKGECLD